MMSDDDTRLIPIEHILQDFLAVDGSRAVLVFHFRNSSAALCLFVPQPNCGKSRGCDIA